MRKAGGENFEGSGFSWVGRTASDQLGKRDSRSFRSLCMIGVSFFVFLPPLGHCAASALLYDSPGRRSTQICLDLLRGGASHSDSGRGLYATHAPLAPLSLRSCSICNPPFPADRFSDSISAPAGHEFIRQKQHQTARQSELHEQRHLCE